MKIVLSFPQCHRRSGVERVMYECARFLVGRGHDVVVAAEQWEPLPEAAGPGQIEYLKVPAASKASSPWAAAKTFAQRSRKTIQDAGLSDALHNGHGCVCSPEGVAWVHSVHQAWLERRQQLGLDRTLAQRIKRRINPLHRTLLRLEKNYFDDPRIKKLIALTPQVASDLYRLYSVAPERVVLIPNGYDPEEFCPERRRQRRDESRASLGLAPETPALLFVGHEIARKGLATAMQALQQLDRQDAQLLVVGRLQEDRVFRLAQQHGVDGRVKFCGPTADLGLYHAAADAMVLPTQYEAFCLAILEALGSGLPAVTSAVPGAQDAIRVDVNGSLIEDPLDAAGFANQLNHWLQVSSERGDDLSDQVANSVCKYRWSSVLTRYESVLLQCDSASLPLPHANPAPISSNPVPAGRVSATPI